MSLLRLIYKETMASTLGTFPWIYCPRGKTATCCEAAPQRVPHGEKLKTANIHLTEIGNGHPFPTQVESSDETTALADSKLRRDIEWEAPS